MAKSLITEEESKQVATDVLLHCYGEPGFDARMIENVTQVLLRSLEKVMENRSTKPIDPYPYLITEDQLRAIFEVQHHGRDLKRNRRGTYQSVQIAAIWNQHVRTARAIEKLLMEQLNHSVVSHG